MFNQCWGTQTSMGETYLYWESHTCTGKGVLVLVVLGDPYWDWGGSYWDWEDQTCTGRVILGLGDPYWFQEGCTGTGESILVPEGSYWDWED